MEGLGCASDETDARCRRVKETENSCDKEKRKNVAVQMANVLGIDY